MCDVFRVITAPEQLVLTVRKRVKLSELQKDTRPMFEAVGVYMARNGIEITGPPIAYYHSWSGGVADMECGYPLAQEDAGEGEVHLLKLPLGRAAMALQRGSYDLLAGAHERMEDWIKSKGYTPAAEMWEFFLNNPDFEPEESLKTQIFWPMS